MTTPRIVAITQQYRAALMVHEAKATQALNAGYQAALAKITPQLSALLTQIAEQQQSGAPVPITWLYEQRRLQTVQRLVTNEITQYAALSQIQAGQLQHVGVQLGTQGAQRLLQATVPVGVRYTFGVPSTQAIAHIVGVTQSGSPLSDLFAGFGDEAAKKVSDALISGVTLGSHPRVVARSVQQALGISRNRALTTSRNEMLRCYRSANLENFRANSAVVEQWRWTCDASPRTCVACLAMDGTLHSLDESMDSHVQCRCVPVPVTKSWADILSPLGIDGSDLDDESSSVAALPTGASWFADQSAEVQRDMLGDAAYQLYANGDATLQDFVGVNHDATWGDSVRVKTAQQVMKGQR